MSQLIDPPTITLVADKVPTGWAFIADAGVTHNPSITRLEESFRFRWPEFTQGREAKLVKARDIGVQWVRPSGRAYRDDEGVYFALIVKNPTEI